MKLQFDNIVREDDSVETMISVLYDFICVLASSHGFSDDSILDSLRYIEDSRASSGVNTDVVLLDLRDMLRMCIHNKLSYGLEDKDNK